jgi:hypothetical protein
MPLIGIVVNRKPAWDCGFPQFLLLSVLNDLPGAGGGKTVDKPKAPNYV